VRTIQYSTRFCLSGGTGSGKTQGAYSPIKTGRNRKVRKRKTTRFWAKSGRSFRSF